MVVRYAEIDDVPMQMKTAPETPMPFF